ncbi:hypothetical protein F511_11375 [Dorcoceras hygrometricum]|uniref:Uncharacterized protein n=1 Tax=Dorcoceras hygrometricum TaxID=472368 RepID=A0A2Z7A6U7_9LAMI|nr:hypothetical protein F511_11375 [Dorcoceras hygrometricum]
MIVTSPLKKMLMSKFKLQKDGRGRKANVSSLVSKPNLSEEYKEAFRTKSYTEICNKARSQLETKKSFDAQSLHSLSTPPHPRNVQLVDSLLEPRQETLTPILEDPNLQIFADYFNTSREAFENGELLLKNINQGRITYLETQNMIKKAKCLLNGSSWTNDEYCQVQNILVSFTSQNPLSVISPEKFHELHLSHMILYRELTSQYNKTKQRIKANRRIKLVKTVFKVVGGGTLVVALLVLAMHSTIGMVVGPIILACFLVLLLARKKTKQGLTKEHLKREFALLDTAARGVYTLINDFDTVSWLEKTMNEEMEHMHSLVDICLKKGRSATLKVAAKVFQKQEPKFLEQLEELEKHTYLSLLNINRTRKQVMQEMNMAET